MAIWKKVVFATLTTCVFFLLLEGLLALLDVRPTIETHDPFVGFESSLPLYVESPGAEGHVVLTTAPNKLAYFNQQTFLKKKPTGTYRIFCLGGSTTYGRPYDDRTSFPGWLRQILPTIDSNRQWEVINAGGVSYASYRIAALMEELAQYQPDLIVLSTGHNEFLEERTYGKMRQMSATQRTLITQAARSRTFALLQSLMGTSTPLPSNRYQMPTEVDAKLDHTVGPSSYQRNDELTPQILTHFEINLLRIQAICQRCGAKFVLVTPVCNLKDFSPFKSEHGVKENTNEFQQWSKHFEEARRWESTEDWEQALEAYQSAEAIDDRYADLHYRKAHVLFHLKRYAESTKSFQRAVDEDVCPLRAISQLQKQLHQVAKEADIPLVDFHAHLRNECLRTHGHNAPGNEYFLDHVHPSIETNGQIASEIANRLIELGIVDASGPCGKSTIQSARKQIASKINEVDHAVALRNLAKVLNWAGKHREAGPLALKAVQTLDKDPESLFLSGTYLKQNGKTDQAIEYFRKALRHNPEYLEVHQLIGAALVEKGEYEQALMHFKQVIKHKPDDGDAYHMSGAVLAELGRCDEALPYYQRALEAQPKNAHLHYNLARALAKLGHSKEAIREYKQCLHHNPQDADAHNNIGLLFTETGDFDEAIRHYQFAIKLDPDSADIKANLQRVIQKKENHQQSRN